ncbi:MAG: glycoside hydrolase family 5 protein [Muribaculaceae bacterium]|nr:glycoside hydrolase family 5 protein [Muribaculaceae bacterium]
MKFIDLCRVFMFVALFGGAIGAAEAQRYENRVLWEGSRTQAEWASPAFFHKCQFSDLAPGDELVFKFSNNNNGQIQLAVTGYDSGFDKTNTLFLLGTLDSDDWRDLYSGGENFSEWSVAMPAAMTSQLNKGNFLAVAGHDFTFTEISVRHNLDYEAPDPEDPANYKTGRHFFKPGELPFEGGHDFGTGWENKLVFHPGVFSGLDSEKGYWLKVQGNGSIQFGLGYWEDCAESAFDASEALTFDGSAELPLSNTILSKIQNGWCVQFNGENSSVSRIELVEGKKVVEPDFSTAGFHVSGTKVLDAYDNEFVMRGVNYSWAWQGNEGVIDEAARAGFNTVRIQVGSGNKWSYGSAAALEGLIKRCERAGVVCMFNVQDYTDSSDPDDLRKAVDYWCKSDIVAVMNRHIGSTILNINNEWPAVTDQELWRDGYLEALPRIREAGYRGMMVVDCGGWGQDAWCSRYAAEVFESDPLANTIFSIHMYQTAGHQAYYKYNLDNFRNQDLAIMIGEIAFEHKAGDYSAYPSGGPVAWREILQYCYENNVGWIAWSWTGNGGGAETCDIYGNGGIQENGKCLMYGRYGMKETSAPCQVFSDEPLQGESYRYPVDMPGFSVENPECEYPYPGRDYADDDRESDQFNQSLPYSLSNQRSCFWIKSAVFESARQGDRLEITLRHDRSDSDVLIGYFGYFGDTEWHTVHNMTGSDEERVEIPLFPQQNGRRTVTSNYVDNNPELASHLKYTGMFVRGSGFTVLGAAVKGNGDDVITSVGDNIMPADGAPEDIYTVTGVKVSSMTSGGVYIVRKGSDVRKVVR